MIHVFGVVFSVLVQRLAVMRIIELTGGHSGAPPPMPADSSAPSGPPPALAAAVGAVQRNGMILAVAIIAIVFLMVVKLSLGG